MRFLYIYIIIGMLIAAFTLTIWRDIAVEIYEKDHRTTLFKLYMVGMFISIMVI